IAQTARCELGDERSEFFLVAADQYDMRAKPGEQNRDGAADAAGAARDERNLALERVACIDRRMACKPGKACVPRIIGHVAAGLVVCVRADTLAAQTAKNRWHARSLRFSHHPTLARATSRPPSALLVADAERRQGLHHAGGDRLALRSAPRRFQQGRPEDA